MNIEDEFEYCEKCHDYFYNPKTLWDDLPIFCIVMAGTFTTSLITTISTILFLNGL